MTKKKPHVYMCVHMYACMYMHVVHVLGWGRVFGISAEPGTHFIVVKIGIAQNLRVSLGQDMCPP